MIALAVRFLGGLRQEMGAASTTISLPDNATVAEILPELHKLNIDLRPERNLVVLNDRGLEQWQPDRRIVASDVVIVFPHISGGESHQSNF
jgi:molybdopterin converting factor small subunit